MRLKLEIGHRLIYRVDFYKSVLLFVKVHRIFEVKAGQPYIRHLEVCLRASSG